MFDDLLGPKKQKTPKKQNMPVFYRVRFGYSPVFYREEKGWSEAKIISCCGKWFTIKNVTGNTFTTVEYGPVFEFNFNDVDEMRKY